MQGLVPKYLTLNEYLLFVTMGTGGILRWNTETLRSSSVTLNWKGSGRLANVRKLGERPTKAASGDGEASGALYAALLYSYDTREGLPMLNNHEHSQERAKEVMVKLPVPLLPPYILSFSWDGEKGVYRETFHPDDDADGGLVDATVEMMSRMLPDQHVTRIDQSTVELLLNNPRSAFITMAVEAVLQLEGRGVLKSGTVDKLTLLLQEQAVPLPTLRFPSSHDAIYDAISGKP